MRAISRMLGGVVAMVLAAAGPSAAGIIRYTETVTGSGTLDGTSFTDAPVTISATADAADIINDGSGAFEVRVTGAEVSVGGVGSDAFTGSILVFDDLPSPGIVQLGFGVVGATVMLDLRSSDFPNYDLSAPALITGAAVNLPANDGTTNGTFSLDSVSTAVVFTATAAVPEPSSLALCGIVGAIGLAGIGGRGLLRRRGGRGA